MHAVECSLRNILFETVWLEIKVSVEFISLSLPLSGVSLCLFSFGYRFGMDTSLPGTRVSQPASTAAGGVFDKRTTRSFSVSASKLGSAPSVSRTSSLLFADFTSVGLGITSIVGTRVPGKGANRSLALTAH